MPNDAPWAGGQGATAAVAPNSHSVQRAPSDDFVDRLTQAIQLYADAVAEHALCFEGHSDVGEASSALGLARSHLRDLLQQIRR